MENNNSKFWIYLGLGVIAAMAFKWWISPDSTLPNKHWSLQANMEDEIQYRRSNHKDKIAGLTSSRRSIVQPAEIKSGTTSAAPAAPAKAKQVAKLDNKAKDKKKKKKKKKKLKAIAAPMPANPVATDDRSKHDSDPYPAGTSSSAANTVAGGVGNAPPSDLGPKTLADWEKILLVSPNHRETTRFISLFQSKEVEPEIFYGIVGEMLNDGRTEMRELGVMSLAATPSLQSYTMLVDAAETETGAAKADAVNYLENYNRPQLINVLYAVLTQPNGDTRVEIQALKNLDGIITQTRTPSSTTSPSTPAPKQSAAQAMTQAVVMQYLQRLQSPIAALRTSSDPELQSLASTVLSHISVALNSSHLNSTVGIASNP